jgi:hypothetical protein
MAGVIMSVFTFWYPLIGAVLGCVFGSIGVSRVHPNDPDRMEGMILFAAFGVFAGLVWPLSLLVALSILVGIAVSKRGES